MKEAQNVCVSSQQDSISRSIRFSPRLLVICQTFHYTTVFIQHVQQISTETNQKRIMFEKGAVRPAGFYKKKKGRGLIKPLTVSTDLAAIMGTKKGEKLSRAEVTKRLWAYIKENKLQDPDNGQYFKPNKTMVPVFGSESIKAFGMVKFLKGHLTDVWTINVF